MEKSEEVVDWWDLVEQMFAQSGQPEAWEIYIAAAMLMLARELKWYRQWAEEHHST